MSKRKQPTDRQIWEGVVEVSIGEPCPRIEGHHVKELTDDREAIRRALKESRMRHTVHVTSKLP